MTIMGKQRLNKFCERISELRLEKGMSRQELADKLHISVRLVGYWENGERECSLDMLIKISQIFNTSTDFLIGKTDF